MKNRKANTQSYIDRLRKPGGLPPVILKLNTNHRVARPGTQ